jgi:hypothetical protein
MFLAAKWIRSIDSQARLILNPPRIQGQDQVFRNPATGAVTYVLRAEKAPNRRGAEKLIAHFANDSAGRGNSLDELAGAVKNGNISAVDM